ncbi:MAG: hypothetical protein QM786_17805 [Breznakibacter sp.]
MTQNPELVKIKVCGMRDPDNIAQLMELGPDYVGFIFYAKSPRYVGMRFPRETAFLADAAQKVGVFVDNDFDDVPGFRHPLQARCRPVARQ